MAEEELGLAATAATGSASTVTNETNETSWAQGLRRSANALGQKTTKTAPNAHYDLVAGTSETRSPQRGAWTTMGMPISVGRQASPSPTRSPLLAGRKG